MSGSYLRPNAALEPLVHQWPAHFYPLTPAAGALYLEGVQLPAMELVLRGPGSGPRPSRAVGVMASHIDIEREPELEALVRATRERAAGTLELARALRALDAMLKQQAQGQGLAPLYAQVPPPLRGYVELGYSAQGAPSARLLEGALYRSRHHDVGAQGVALSLINGDARPNFFSPRFDGVDCLTLPVALSSPTLDALARMRTQPGSVEAVADALRVGPEQRALFSRLFTDAPPRLAKPYDGDGVRIRYFGHACVLIEARGVSILADPWVSYPVAEGPDRFTYEDLPEHIDYVLISHAHQDHFVPETLLALRHRIGTVVVPRAAGGTPMDPSFRLLLSAAGFRRVVELEDMEGLEVEGGSITAVPFLGEHCDLHVRGKAGYVVTLGGRPVLVAADTNCLEPRVFDFIHQAHGDLEAMFLGMDFEGGALSFLYGQFLDMAVPPDVDASRRANGAGCDKALEMVERLSPRRVFIYGMLDEPWLAYMSEHATTTEDSPRSVECRRFLAACHARGVEAERLFCQREFSFSRVR